MLTTLAAGYGIAIQTHADHGISVQTSTQDDGTLWVTLTGPLDVVYWLAEDVDAFWG
jgi:hypothetical protein